MFTFVSDLAQTTPDDSAKVVAVTLVVLATLFATGMIVLIGTVYRRRAYGNVSTKAVVKELRRNADAHRPTCPNDRSLMRTVILVSNGYSSSYYRCGSCGHEAMDANSGFALTDFTQELER